MSKKKKIAAKCMVFSDVYIKIERSPVSYYSENAAEAVIEKDVCKYRLDYGNMECL